MKKFQLVLLVISVAVSAVFAGLLAMKLSKVYPCNTFTVQYKSQNPITPEVFYQKSLKEFFTQKKIVSKYNLDKKTGLVSGKIVIPTGPVAVLRLDFGISPGKVEIKNLTFRSKKIKKSTLLKSNFLHVDGIEFPKECLVRFNSFAADPQVIFPLQLCNVYPFNIWYCLGLFVVSLAILFPVLLLAEKLIRSRKKAEKK